MEPRYEFGGRIEHKKPKIVVDDHIGGSLTFHLKRIGVMDSPSAYMPKKSIWWEIKLISYCCKAMKDAFFIEDEDDWHMRGKSAFNFSSTRHIENNCSLSSESVPNVSIRIPMVRWDDCTELNDVTEEYKEIKCCPFCGAGIVFHEVERVLYVEKEVVLTKRYKDYDEMVDTEEDGNPRVFKT